MFKVEEGTASSVPSPLESTIELAVCPEKIILKLTVSLWEIWRVTKCHSLCKTSYSMICSVMSVEQKKKRKNI